MSYKIHLASRVGFPRKSLNVSFWTSSQILVDYQTSPLIYLMNLVIDIVNLAIYCMPLALDSKVQEYQSFTDD